MLRCKQKALGHLGPTGQRSHSFDLPILLRDSTYVRRLFKRIPTDPRAGRKGCDFVSREACYV